MPNMPEYRVVRNARARHLRLRLFPNGELRVTAPRGVSDRAIARFVALHRDWIESKRRELRQAAPCEPPRRVDLVALGERWRVCWGAASAWVDEDGFRLAIPSEYGREGQEWLRRWLMARARAALGPWLAEVSSHTGLKYGRLRVATQKTRWGSCSSSGTISLNARMLLLPSHLVDYLLVHELCHTREMNHGAAFWALVERHCPDYQEAERQLDRVARSLPAWSGFPL